MWFICLRRSVLPREQWTVSVDEHLVWMKRMHEAGSIVMSGPGKGPDGTPYGMYLIRAASKGEAEIVTTTIAFLAHLAIAAASGQPAPALRIVVIQGEDAVNIIQQKTAVAPVVEIRDRNNLPVAGATVTFTIGGNAASFAGGVQTITVATNAVGQAAAVAINPIASGAVQIQVAAAFQGQAAAATIVQTNVLTAAQDLRRRPEPRVPARRADPLGGQRRPGAPQAVAAASRAPPSASSARQLPAARSPLRKPVATMAAATRRAPGRGVSAVPSHRPSRSTSKVARAWNRGQGRWSSA